jgi:ankyrin repeat protein
MISIRTAPTKAAFLALTAILALSAYFLSSPLHLALAGLSTESTVHSKRVDAQEFGAEWFDAARAGRVDMLSALVDEGYPIDTQSGAGYTALILAAYDAHSDALAYLLTKHANPCLGDRKGNTALMGALYKGEEEIASILMHTGCPIDQANSAGETALSFAVSFGRKDAIPTLLDLGADAHHRDLTGDTPYEMAIEQGDTSTLETLKAYAARDMREGTRR